MRLHWSWGKRGTRTQNLHIQLTTLEKKRKEKEKEEGEEGEDGEEGEEEEEQGRTNSKCELESFTPLCSV